MSAPSTLLAKAEMKRMQRALRRASACSGSGGNKTSPCFSRGTTAAVGPSDDPAPDFQPPPLFLSGFRERDLAALWPGPDWVADAVIVKSVPHTVTIRPVPAVGEDLKENKVRRCP
ncbi:hypothetical protein AAFF_G00305590 [Aldrovandia affinis]|uniref:Uncharacterized protein n=1 Tax=Aldrovandia affinis TaxID=143900 RepID=A0AAD7SPP2_9TELE|nr:hypothetical protein AAFF_G00305590 [Aldrovandia affinis]